MKGLGCLFVLIAGAVIFLHTVIYASHNERMVSEHPFRTVLTGGKDLIQRYTFTPPLQPFEIFIYLLGIVGIVLFIVGCAKAKDKDENK